MAPGGARWAGLAAFCGQVAHFVAPSPDGGPMESGIRPSPSLKSSPTKLMEAGVFGECSKVRTFAGILNSKPRSCIGKNGAVDFRREAVGSVQVLHSAVSTMERVVWSSSSLDLFPVPIRFELESDGEGVRSAVDCSTLEDFVPVSLEVAAGFDMVSSSEV
jgi:hypothetical protein